MSSTKNEKLPRQQHEPSRSPGAEQNAGANKEIKSTALTDKISKYAHYDRLEG